MARLNIPARDREGLLKLLKLPAEAFAQFISRLQAHGLTLDLLSQLREAITVPGVSKADADQIVSAVLAISLVRWQRESPLDKLAGDLSETIQLFDPVGGTAESKRRFLTLLKVEPLTIAAKALTIFTDYQRTMHGAKLLTDVRYVFQSDPDEEPYGAVIVHLLKLSYHEDGDHKEFFVAMDDDDVARLKAVLKRAEAKVKTLRRKLDTAGTKYISSSSQKEERGNL
ncbi:MAG TPA: hypothetical protein VIX59_01395 [Candidatus Binataceae bacterium]